MTLENKEEKLGKQKKSLFSEEYAKPGSVSCCGSLEVSDSLCTLTVTLSKPWRKKGMQLTLRNPFLLFSMFHSCNLKVLVNKKMYEKELHVLWCKRD